MGDVTRREALVGLFGAALTADSFGCGKPEPEELPEIGVRMEGSKRVPYISHGVNYAQVDPNTGKLAIYSRVKCMQDPEAYKVSERAILKAINDGADPNKSARVTIDPNSAGTFTDADMKTLYRAANPGKPYPGGAVVHTPKP